MKHKIPKLLYILVCLWVVVVLIGIVLKSPQLLVGATLSLALLLPLSIIMILRAIKQARSANNQIVPEEAFEIEGFLAGIGALSHISSQQGSLRGSAEGIEFVDTEGKSLMKLSSRDLGSISFTPRLRHVFSFQTGMLMMRFAGQDGKDLAIFSIVSTTQMKRAWVLNLFVKNLGTASVSKELIVDEHRIHDRFQTIVEDLRRFFPGKVSGTNPDVGMLKFTAVFMAVIAAAISLPAIIAFGLIHGF